MKENYDVFLAYSRKDYGAADEVAGLIKKNGFSLWRDTDNLNADGQFGNHIEDAIKSSKTIVAIYSTWANNSEWFKHELSYARQLSKPIICVCTNAINGEISTANLWNMLKVGSTNFEERLILNLLMHNCTPNTYPIYSMGQDIYNSARVSKDKDLEATSFHMLLRAAELGDKEALFYVTNMRWDINLSKAIATYSSIDSNFIIELRAGLYNKGKSLLDKSLPIHNRITVDQEKTAFRLTKRALDLGYIPDNDSLCIFSHLSEKDIAKCFDQLGESAKIFDHSKTLKILNFTKIKELAKEVLTSNNTSSNRVFISYKRVDFDKVSQIKSTIERAIGEECWFDLDGIESDAQFVNVIMKAINQSQVMLFMYSLQHSKIEDYENDWTIREINFAKLKKKRIVFVNIDNTPLTDWFEFMFPQKQQVDATNKDALAKLCQDIPKWLK